MIPVRFAILGSMVCFLTVSSPANAALVNGVFEIGLAEIIDLYSATFDGALNPSCAGASDPDECTFFGGNTPTTRNVTVNSAAPASATGTLDILYDNVTGEISTINALFIQLPDAELNINEPGGGSTVVTITQGNSQPVANDSLFLSAAGDVDESDPALGPGVFEFDDAPNTDAPDFANFADIVDNCSGALCGLITILSLDGTRYRLLGVATADGGDAFQLQAQQGSGGSIYKVDFTTVPLPAGLWLLISAMAALAGTRRRSSSFRKR